MLPNRRDANTHSAHSSAAWATGMIGYALPAGCCYFYLVRSLKPYEQLPDSGGDGEGAEALLFSDMPA